MQQVTLLISSEALWSKKCGGNVAPICLRFRPQTGSGKGINDGAKTAKQTYVRLSFLKGDLGRKIKVEKHTTAGIRWWSPTQLLTGRRVA
ncbi:hypothetical protein BJX96DRAFT_39294 [Aspergillus floccosus]